VKIECGVSFDTTVISDEASACVLPGAQIEGVRSPSKFAGWVSARQSFGRERADHSATAVKRYPVVRASCIGSAPEYCPRAICDAVAGSSARIYLTFIAGTRGRVGNAKTRGRRGWVPFAIKHNSCISWFGHHVAANGTRLVVVFSSSTPCPRTPEVFGHGVSVMDSTYWLCHQGSIQHIAKSTTRQSGFAIRLLPV